MLLESFGIHKTLVNKVLLKTIKLNIFFVIQTFIKSYQIYYGI
jgi:hypothetical protein